MPLPERALDSTASGFRDQEINGVLWRSFTVQAGDLRVSTADRLEERDVLQRSVVVAAAVPVTVALLGSLALLWLGAGQVWRRSSGFATPSPGAAPTRWSHWSWRPCRAN